MTATILQKVRQWMELQQEFGEDWVLAERPNILDEVYQKTGRKTPPAINRSVQPATFGKAATPKAPTSEGPVFSVSRSAAFIHPISPSSMAVEASSLDELRAQLYAFNGCALKKMATHTVFSDGNPRSPLMFVGEAPGADEDLQGVPFVGASGQLLNKMLAAIHIRRPDVYITNVVNWRPPGNRPPTPDEIALCLPFLERHIALVAPKFLVLLGGTAMRAVLRRTGSLSQARGVWHLHTPVPGAEPIRTLVTFHPSYLLRSPGQKTLAWKDLQMLQAALHQEGFFLDSAESLSPSVEP